MGTGLSIADAGQIAPPRVALVLRTGDAAVNPRHSSLANTAQRPVLLRPPSLTLMNGKSCTIQREERQRRSSNENVNSPPVAAIFASPISNSVHQRGFSNVVSQSSKSAAGSISALARSCCSAQASRPWGCGSWEKFTTAVKLLTVQSTNTIRASEIATELQAGRRAILRYAFDRDQNSFRGSREAAEQGDRTSGGGRQAGRIRTSGAASLRDREGRRGFEGQAPRAR